MRRTTSILVALFIATALGYAQDPAPAPAQDPKEVKYTNESIARLSFIEGKAFVQRASDLGYEEAAVNMPISEGDRIGTTDGRAEIHFGKGNFIRLDADTKLDVLNLPKKDDSITRFRVWSGNIYVVVGTLKKEKSIELHTADSSFYVLDRGVYRVNVRENRDTEIEVFAGLIEAAGEGGSTVLKASQRLEISEGRFDGKPATFIAVANDSFDKFNESRTAVTAKQYAKAYLPEDLSDFEAELDENGEWINVAPYGDVWVPGGVDDDWRPYYNGQWTWLPLSGWTWWPYDPWGWATFHYGRWHWGVSIGWYWIPTSIWGPAWVNWWWDDFYFGWAPISYWGYPGVCYGGYYYGGYYGPYYPYHSSAMTVVRKDHLKAPVRANALKGDSLKALDNKIKLTNSSLNLKPAGTKLSVQTLDGNRVMLRRDDSKMGLQPDRSIGRGAARGASTGSGLQSIRPSDPGKAQGQSSGKAVKPQTIKSPDKGAKSSAPAKTAGTPKSSDSGDRKIRKFSSGSATAQSGSSGTKSSLSGSRTATGYPSSPSVTRPKSYGDGGTSRARTFSGPSSKTSSGKPSSGSSTVRSSGSSSGRSTSRVGSSSSGRSSGASRGSASRGSSSGGSRSAGGGGVRRK
jgi:hypothetical protein